MNIGKKLNLSGEQNGLLKWAMANKDELEYSSDTVAGACGRYGSAERVIRYSLFVNRLSVNPLSLAIVKVHGLIPLRADFP